MRKVVMFAAAVGMVLAAAVAPAAAKGGWAVPSFDPLPPLEADRPVTIGLTLLQHGVHPVTVDDVTLTFTDDRGVTTRVAATPDGPEGHYVAPVQLPAGAYRWSVQPGFFPERELGTIDVAAPTDGSTVAPSPATASAGGDGGAGPSTARTVARVALPIAAVLVAIGGFAARRPRRAVLSTS
jgi:hypothetical protein